MRSRESFDEFEIGFRELIGPKVLRFHPSKLRNFDRLGLATDDHAVEEVKVDRPCGIVVNRRVVLVANLCAHAQFFEKLPAQRVSQGLSLFNLASGEFPEIGQMGIGSAPGEQDVFVSSNDRCGYCDQGFQSVSKMPLVYDVRSSILN